MRTKEEILEVNCHVTEHQRVVYSRIDSVYTAMEEYASQFKQEWIPVTESLPENILNVLVKNKFGIKYIMWLNSDGSWIYGTQRAVELGEQFNPTHWMELPE